jgi:HK97 family phage portal protein
MRALFDPRVVLAATREPAPPVPRRSSYTMAQLGKMIEAAAPSAPRVASVDQALRNGALWACVLIKAKGIASLPVDVVRYVDGARQPVPSTPKVIARPSAVVRPLPWRFQRAWSLFTDGNAFAEIVAADSFGRPTQLELIDPTGVTHRRVEKGVGKVDMADGTTRSLWPNGDLWHMAGEMVPAGSPFALSPIEYAAKAIGTSLAAADFGGAFFGSSAIPSSVLYLDTDPGPDEAETLVQRMIARWRSRQPAVLGAGMKLEQVQVDPKNSQFIDLLRFCVEEVARFMGVPPSMVYGAVSGQAVTYANVSDADLHYLKHSLSWPIALVEEADSELIPAPQVVRLNRDAILRSDTLGRYQAHEVALRNRWRTVNEVRRLEDEPPFGPEFDEPGVPGDTPDTPDTSDTGDETEGGR